MLTLREVETHFAHLPPGLLEMAPELRRLAMCHARFDPRTQTFREELAGGK